MLDVELFGLAPAGHHLTNLFIHVANTLLLFLFLHRTTSAAGRSVLVAALFALHPLHVESVAWITERKDILSTFFMILTIWAYVRYTQQPGVKRYLWMLFCFALGLMSKPMLVTLPVLLLLLDYWPLCRLHWRANDVAETENDWPRHLAPAPGTLLLEKTPLFAGDGCSAQCRLETYMPPVDAGE